MDCFEGSLPDPIVDTCKRQLTNIQRDIGCFFEGSFTDPSSKGLDQRIEPPYRTRHAETYTLASWVLQKTFNLTTRQS